MLLNWFVHYRRFGRFKSMFDRDALPFKSLESFPRIIHIYWHSGRDAAPPLVQRCITSWVDKHPGWEVVVWSDATAPIARSILPPDASIAHYSDMLRTWLLKERGGVWADATLYCNCSLDDWLLPIMLQCDFFAFGRPPGGDRAISNWFLASRPGGAIITTLWDSFNRFWQGRKKTTRVYHWFHYIFEFLERTSPRFRKEWAKTPRIAAAPMPRLAQDKPFEITPVMHKLTHKRPLAHVEAMLE